tara:strand:- start:140 stop:454 length:315 start_codon:yes stop_codon:yes gene_type:complete
MVIYVDIDETICHYLDERNYSLAQPIVERIQRINSLYDEGKKIVYWTARGCTTGIDWTKTTQEQLKQWGAKYHELKMNHKPHYDLLICDKAINSNTFFNEGTNE